MDRAAPMWSPSIRVSVVFPGTAPAQEQGCEQPRRQAQEERLYKFAHERICQAEVRRHARREATLPRKANDDSSSFLRASSALCLERGRTTR